MSQLHSPDFTRCFRTFRRRIDRRARLCAASAAACPVLGLAAVLVVVVRCGWCGAGIFAVLPVAAWLGYWRFRRKNRMTDADCARLFDRLAGTGSTVANALDLEYRRATGIFADFAVHRAVCVFSLPVVLPPGRYAWKTGAGLTAALLVSAVLPLSALSGLPERTVSLLHAATGDVADETQLQSPAMPLSVRVTPANRQSRGGSADFARSPKSAPAAGSGENAADAPAAPRADDTAAQENAPDNDAAPGEKSASSGGISGSGGLDGAEESGRQTDLKSGMNRTGRSASRRERRKREVRRRDTSARGGAQPLPADTAPQAGRELGEKEEDGDQPSEGRGGESGAKKSRGAAAALPVVPLPDTVTGRLGEGEDITAPERGGFVRDDEPKSGMLAPAGREPALSSAVLPRTLRILLKNL